MELLLGLRTNADLRLGIVGVKGLHDDVVGPSLDVDFERPGGFIQTVIQQMNILELQFETAFRLRRRGNRHRHHTEKQCACSGRETQSSRAILR